MQTMHFADWLSELKRLAPEYNHCDEEFRDSYDEGMTPQQAIDEDRSYADYA